MSATRVPGYQTGTRVTGILTGTRVPVPTITEDDSTISCCEEIKYLVVYIISGKAFGCSFKHAKESFYRSFNGIFGRVGRIASENVIVELINTKCMPVLLWC